MSPAITKRPLHNLLLDVKEKVPRTLQISRDMREQFLGGDQEPSANDNLRTKHSIYKLVPFVNAQHPVYFDVRKDYLRLNHKCKEGLIIDKGVLLNLTDIHTTACVELIRNLTTNIEAITGLSWFNAEVLGLRIKDFPNLVEWCITIAGITYIGYQQTLRLFQHHQTLTASSTDSGTIFLSLFDSILTRDLASIWQVMDQALLDQPGWKMPRILIKEHVLCHQGFEVRMQDLLDPTGLMGIVLPSPGTLEGLNIVHEL